jgi:hypothetical protein
MAAAEPRQARLRPESAHRYPELPAGCWMPAGELAARWLRAADSVVSAAGGRLPPEDFEFRAGATESDVRGRARTRRSDRPKPIDRAGARSRTGAR